jgi:phage tail-like protein
VANVLRIDPLAVFNFYITLVDSPAKGIGTIISMALNYFVAGFSECSGIDATIETQDYKEGGLNDRVLRFATRTAHSAITLKHGVIYLYDDLWTWHNEWVKGRGKRKDGLIVLQDEGRKPAKIWKFKRGIPTKWVGPSLNAAQNQVAIESLEIVHEGLELKLGA